MISNRLLDWIDEISTASYAIYIKRLSGNDTLANGSHQAGPYFPKDVIFDLFPSINDPLRENPDVRDIPVNIDSDCSEMSVRAVWYNNKVTGSGTRDEARITGWGGVSSQVLDPDSTGSIVMMAFERVQGHDARLCRTWVCSTLEEEHVAEDAFGPIEPGSGIYIGNAAAEDVETFGAAAIEPRSSCWLRGEEIPREWLSAFPDGASILEKALELNPFTGKPVDERLLLRRRCEYQVFRSLEEAVVMPRIAGGFETVDEFVDCANSVLQRRKARGGRSFELHIKKILQEEGMNEGVDFTYAPVLENNKRPDFIFPSIDAYRNETFPIEKFVMLAAKTTCKDRWRQILEEAGRIRSKHLITLQEGVSSQQYQQMRDAGVVLVVPEDLKRSYSSEIRGELVAFETFINNVKRILQ